MGYHNNGALTCTLAFIILPVVLCDVPVNINPGILTQGKSLGDCQACKVFIESFKAGLDRTSRGKYEGGDAAWEEEKQKKTYKRSEMRLIDIQEGICKEYSKVSLQCHHMAEKAEEFIEEWWAQDPNESDDLYTYICIDKLKVCCPHHHYGKDCKPCIGDPTNLCSGNGKCRGDGTRKGNGTCACEPSFDGENCEKCSISHFKSADDDKLQCSPCHKSCMGGCRAGTEKDCVACSAGYVFDSDEGCIDINECDETGICQKQEFCLNMLGSYVCGACFKGCDGCYSDGPDSCIKCAKNYVKKGQYCQPEKDDNLESQQALTMSRENEEL